MGVNREQMDQLQGREDICRGKQSLRNELWIKVIPVLPRNVCGARIQFNLIRLLDVGERPEKTNSVYAM